MGSTINHRAFWYAVLLLILAECAALVLKAIILRHSRFVRENTPGFD